MMLSMSGERSCCVGFLIKDRLFRVKGVVHLCGTLQYCHAMLRL